MRGGEEKTGSGGFVGRDCRILCCAGDVDRGSGVRKSCLSRDLGVDENVRYVCMYLVSKTLVLDRHEYYVENRPANPFICS